MRVEPAPFVFRNEDRRQRSEDRRGAAEDRRAEAQAEKPRASHVSQPWLAPAFGAHILGQVAPSRVEPSVARRAYMQPEAKTPLKPSREEEA